MGPPPDDENDMGHPGSDPKTSLLIIDVSIGVLGMLFGALVFKRFL
jgi:hypothetical protein